MDRTQPPENAGSPWHIVAPGEDVPRRFNVIIEIPMGSSNKYEMDKKTGLLKLDRALYSALPVVEQGCAAYRERFSASK